MASESSPPSSATITSENTNAPPPEEEGNILSYHRSSALKDLNESKAELLSRVQSLRKDLKDWRGKLDNQVQSYRQELGELRSTLNVEVEQLKSEFQDLRVSLQKQLDVTAKLSELVPNKISLPMKCNPENDDETDETTAKKGEEKKTIDGSSSMRDAEREHFSDSESSES